MSTAPTDAPAAAGTDLDTDDDRIRRQVVVRAPQARCFEVFTAGIAGWWPMATHKVGAADCAAVVIEPFVGGRWFERGTDGTECPWGEVLVWSPPSRVCLAWRLDARWQFDPSLHTEVDVRFVPLDAGRTEVTLEHRGLAAYGADRAAMHAAFGAEHGWAGMLAHFAGGLGAGGGGGATA